MSSISSKRGEGGVKRWDMTKEVVETVKVSLKMMSSSENGRGGGGGGSHAKMTMARGNMGRGRE